MIFAVRNLHEGHNGEQPEETPGLALPVLGSYTRVSVSYLAMGSSDEVNIPADPPVAKM